MSDIEFSKRSVIAKIRNPLKNFQISEEEIEVRSDPLLGHTMRISKPKGLDKIPDENFLESFAENASSCFFCAGRVEKQTPMIPEEIYPDGRIQAGEAMVFPNLSGFGRYSGVCIFSKDHFISIEKFTAKQIFDALKACQFYLQACAKTDRDILYPSINGNYLLPAGSSILHPHLQPFLDPYPTNYHNQLIARSEEYYQTHSTNFWYDLKNTERDGARFLEESDHCYLYTPFAPTGFFEINAIIGSGETYPDLSEEVLDDLSKNIRKIFQFYHKIKHNSFNIALFSPSYHKKLKNSILPCILKICTRPAFMAYYRNDVTFFEKFHNESMIDQLPEDTATAYRKHILAI